MNCFICRERLLLIKTKYDYDIGYECYHGHFVIYFSEKEHLFVEDIITTNERISFEDKYIYGPNISITNFLSLPTLKEAEDFFNKWQENKIFS